MALEHKFELNSLVAPASSWGTPQTGSVLLLILILALVTVLASCGGGATLYAPPTTFSLTANRSSLNFGNVNVGSSSTASVTLTNTGTGSVTVSQATLSTSAFSLRGLSLPLTLSAGQTASFSVKFAPTAGGKSTDSLVITSTASGSPTVVSLSGTGVTATVTLSLTPTSTSFGNVVVGSNSVLPVFVTNTGTDSATITAAAATGPGFSLSGLSLPLSLTPSQKISFSVTFAPTVAGSASGNVSLTSNAIDSPTNEPLSGMGVNSHSVALSWTASTSPDVSGYNIYRGTVSGGPYTVLLNSSLVSNTAYTDSTAGAGQTYYYVATAVNSSGGESAYSNEASAVVPSP